MTRRKQGRTIREKIELRKEFTGEQITEISELLSRHRGELIIFLVGRFGERKFQYEMIGVLKEKFTRIRYTKRTDILRSLTKQYELPIQGGFKFTNKKFVPLTDGVFLHNPITDEPQIETWTATDVALSRLEYETRKELRNSTDRPWIKIFIGDEACKKYLEEGKTNLFKTKAKELLGFLNKG